MTVHAANRVTRKSWANSSTFAPSAHRPVAGWAPRPSTPPVTKPNCRISSGVLIEELVRQLYELPSLKTLSLITAHARSTLHESIYQAFVDSMDTALTERLDGQFVNDPGQTRWDALKRKPKRPRPREVASFLKHILKMGELADGLPPPPEILSAPKRTQLVIEARALDVHEMRALKPTKRYALAVLFICSQLQKALHDVAEIFIKTVRNLERTAKLRLQQYRLAHADQAESLIGQFRDVLGVLQDTSVPDAARIEQMRAALDNDPGDVLTRCNEHIAFAGNHAFPFMLAPYGGTALTIVPVRRHAVVQAQFPRVMSSSLRSHGCSSSVRCVARTWCTPTMTPPGCHSNGYRGNRKNQCFSRWPWRQIAAPQVALSS